MEFIGYIFAIIIGIILGLIGGGGSILTVPVFVYLFHLDAITATALSLFVVGVSSSIGSINYSIKRLIDYKTAFIFGIPSIFGVLFSRSLVIPNLPNIIINDFGITITKHTFLLIIFAVLMLISAYKMIKKTDRKYLKNTIEPNFTLLVSQGLMVGILTGLIGFGGGFLIVPALVLLQGKKMKEAVATSLFIISLNSLIGFLIAQNTTKIDWDFLLGFTSLSILGIFIGILISKRINSNQLKPIFGWFILMIGLITVLKELFL
ncbi:UPF0721 transmembrane protein [Cloacibacterium rupense]|uniref:Probable membrane transporter protein n=1 Tax=Cloacibacterium rupense TaxID=517423 RepID=A0ABQ2NI12_9FLAO|nr:sulfite exporter TauE/SafE family protein [Cloacibacterium rupense]GGP03876.1 UPF0721 transmembrane protein [Cloacibacterium rupense]